MIVFVSVFIGSQLVPNATDEWFFAIQSGWSLLTIFLILSILRNTITKVICLFELLHISYNLIACSYYIEGLHHSSLAYIHYEHLQDGFNAIEAAILIAGVPWRGVYNGVVQLFGTRPYSGAGNNRHMQGD